MSARVPVALLTLGLVFANTAVASDAGYIYGRIETRGGDTYEGELRWGNEESFWDDIFNATKVRNEHADDVDRDVLRRQRDDWSPLDFLGIDHDVETHIFAIRFGDLKRLEVRGGDDVIAEFRNGQELELKGGSNDVGAQITVVDPKHGRRELSWSRIRKIEFIDTPSKLDDKLGEPIYGTVRSGHRAFTGRIQWDHDECLTSDKLDGDTSDGKVSLEFGDIAAIRKHRRGSLVTLRSGNEMYVRGSNDVNDENRGIVVIVPRMGSVKIGWEDFDEVVFSRAPNSGPSYAEYGKGRDLMGTVMTRSGRHEGRIVFDLDEAYDFELLHGTSGDTEYLIPFREIAKIKPVGRRRAIVVLRKGPTIELRESQDVTRKNDGLLVYTRDRNPTYVDWRDVAEVVFR